MDASALKLWRRIMADLNDTIEIDKCRQLVLDAWNGVQHDKTNG
jgi:hypothetical protein